MKRNLFTSAILAAGLLAMSQQASSAVTYILDNSNTEAWLPDGQPYGYVTLTQNGGNVDFIVDINDALFVPGSNFGLQAFAFNNDFSTNSDFDSADIVSLPSGWSAHVPPGGHSDGMGQFDAQVDTQGTGRVDPLSFTVLDAFIADFEKGSSETAGQGNAWFAAHIAGFCQPGTGGSTGTPCSKVDPSSFWIGGGDGALPPSEIPIPAALWLFGSGLLGMAAAGRRRRTA